MCGGSVPGADTNSMHEGASPRVRGKRRPASLSGRQGGCIPACAGEAKRHRLHLSSTRVHPRVCGGSGRASISRYRGPGASPRVRGKRELSRHHGRRAGCIPACAGEAIDERRYTVAEEVHPRVCGGSFAVLRQYDARGGASPRVRGKPRRNAWCIHHRRCIPACAGEAARHPWWRRIGWVHPRVCGGSATRLRAGPPSAGASPRVRGKRRGRADRQQRRRCIPACAGEAAEPPSARPMPRVHPRVCGGSLDRSPKALSIGGASPRVRGKRVDSILACADMRCIPACAGEALREWAGIYRREVHPRVCGGSAGARGGDAQRLGASPRVRGKLGGRLLAASPGGCIPACAGEASSATPPPSRGQVHPRVCGGSRQLMDWADDAPGASPRVRGKRPAGDDLGPHQRCIPACAGEAQRYTPRSRSWRVHPRVCGGSLEKLARNLPENGASPRVRGKPHVERARRDHHGCIPACAGEAWRRDGSGRRWEVHPRVCGGSSFAFPTCVVISGASPRVRGKPWGRPAGRPHHGCIPACAGEAAGPPITRMP